MSRARRAPSRGRREELCALWRLSLPLILSYGGHQVMSLVDTAMVGRLGATAIAGVGIGNAIYFAITIVGLGCVLGMDPLVSQALGAGEEARARRVLWQGLRLGVTVGLPLTALLALSPALLAPAGIETETAKQVERYLYARLPNVLPFLLFIAARCYLQARGVTRPIVISVILANLVNLVGNAVLIYGDQALDWFNLPGIGLPALGIVGSGLASSLAALVSVLLLAVAIRAIPTPPDPDHRRHDPQIQRSLWRLGLPLGLQLLAEVGVFSLSAVLIGGIGADAAAGHQIAITLASLTFCVALGIASATSVQVGLHVGQGDTPGARRAGLLGLGLAAGFMSLSAAVFLAIPAALAALFTDDPQAVVAAVPLLQIAAVFQLSDGTQVVAAGALRGAGDTRGPLLANLVGHYAIGLPLILALGFGLDLGASGVWWGLSAGLTAVALALALRFVRLSSRPIRRV
jgi:MATE family multidrug resistance protein